MPDKLDASCDVGWYECRYHDDDPKRRCFWWTGDRLVTTPDDVYALPSICTDAYTDFILLVPTSQDNQ